MNREILFKAKRTDNGEWVEGNLITNEKNENQKYIGYIFDERNEVIEDFDIVEVVPDTLCQYTGLTDKNGKKIWENDIVLLREEIQDYEWKAVVKFGNPNGKYNWGWQLVPIGECGKYNWGWQLVPIGECDMNKDILLWIDMEIANCEVIGNIFDNEDLLEVE